MRANAATSINAANIACSFTGADLFLTLFMVLMMALKASVKAVVEAITAVGTMKEPFIVIADEENGIYLAKSGITACAGITYAV